MFACLFCNCFRFVDVFVVAVGSLLKQKLENVFLKTINDKQGSDKILSRSAKVKQDRSISTKRTPNINFQTQLAKMVHKMPAVISPKVVHRPPKCCSLLFRSCSAGGVWGGPLPRIAILWLHLDRF